MTEEKVAMSRNLALLDENTFTKDYVVPLFESMGYTKSEFNGGTYEFGKDAIMVKEIPPDTNFVVLIQSKRKSGFSSKNAINELIVQVSQCINDGVFLTENTRVKADQVYIASPDKLPNRAIEKVFRALPNDTKTKILDGPAVVSLVCKYSDILKKKLLNNNDYLTFSAKLADSNKELLTAIKAKKIVDINQIYSDLSFFIGDIESQSILKSPISAPASIVTIALDEWNSLKPITDKLFELYKLKIFSDENTTIDNKFKKLISRIL
ncbi:MAG: restriction endonuclease [Glaciecola sp.]